MDIRSKEGLDEFFEYIKFNSNDVQITVSTCSQIFEILSNSSFQPIYQTNNHIKNGVIFYKTFFDESMMVDNYKDLKKIITSMFYTNGKSPFFETNSVLILSCMKMVIYRIWQLCLRYTLRHEMVAKLINKCDDVLLERLMISEFKFIQKDIETTQKIIFPIVKKIEI